MWRRWAKEFMIEWYWLKKDIVRKWSLDTPVGVLGILVMIMGFALLIALAQGLSDFFRNAVPWVSGRNISAVYWQSIGFGIKVSFLFLLFSGAIIIYVVLKIFERH